VRGERDLADVDLLLRRSLEADEARAVGLQVLRVHLQLVGGDLEQDLPGLAGRHDHGVADAVGAAAGERPHAVGAGVGVGGVDDDVPDRDAERLRRALGDDGPQPLAEIHRGERDHEPAHGGGVDERLRRVAAEVHPGRVVDGRVSAPSP
jgi:hypothetical protein